ncbi:immunoglobulin-like domain-containing protein [Bizionia hallyeonensis]|uniref:Immunoglobulin-like domain-containing protein n=1 Tax=Bizionia hallyeonensis TaxID=1123757 RepID=A0ABW0C999_9FLAO
MGSYIHGQCAPDVTPPSITCPSNITASCPHAPSLNYLEPATTDLCGPIVLQTYTLSGATNGSSPATGIHNMNSVTFLAGTTTILYEIEDAAGNSSSCTFDVTVTDFTPPIVVCQADITTVNDAGLCTAYVDMFGLNVFPTAFDACSGLSTVPTGVPAGSLFPIGTTTVTWVVTDAAGNFSTCLQDIIVTDEENPTITCPTAITVNTDSGQCDALVTIPPVIASDNCTVSSITNDYNAGGANASGTYPIGTTTVTFTVTDSANRTATCSMDIIVNNNQIPTITLVGSDPVTLEACSPYIEYGATANDTCSGDISGNIVIDTSEININVVGTYNVYYNVTNSNGLNAGTVIRTVNVVDTSSPTLSLIGPNPFVIGDCSTYRELGAEAIDPCFGDISGNVIIDNSSVNTSVLGFYTVTYNVMDASGNTTSEITRTIEVVDINEPVIVLIGNDPQIIEACDTYVELGATAIDPCFGTDFSGDIVVDISAVNFGMIGTYPVTYNVTDNAVPTANVAIEVIRMVEIVDTTGPVITLLGDDPQIIEACSPYIELNATAIDPCFGTDYSTDIIIDVTSVNTSVTGSYTVTYNVMDIEGNSATEVIRTVNVVDTTTPTIICPTDIIVNNDAGLCSAIINYSVTSSDNCPGETVTQTDTTGLTSGDAFPVGTTILEYTVTDSLGNSDSCSFSITVNDIEVPEVFCQDFTMQLDPTTGLATLLPTDIDNGSSDNCNVILSLSQDIFDCSHIGTNIVTLIATDPSGNFSTCEATVTITDAADNSSVSISTPINPICQNQEISITAMPVNGGTTPTYQWQINGIDVPGETGNIFTTSFLNNADEVTVIMTSDASICAQPQTSDPLIIIVNDYNAPANAGSDFTNTVCTNTTISLNGSAVNGINAIGTWSVTSGQISGFSFSDENNPTSTFTGDIGETYTLTWSIDNPEPCIDTASSIEVIFIGCNALDFDGVDDNITFRDNYNLESSFSIEVWVKSDQTNNTIQTILSKREGNNLINGYDLRLVNNAISFHWNNSQFVSASPHEINTNQWYHIAATYDGSEYKLYIDGIELNSVFDTTAPVSNSADCILGAMDNTVSPFIPLNYFDGGLDELRIWDVALTQDQIRKMMNQEIEDNTLVKGSVVPNDISGLNWADLNGYYQMNQNTDLSGGNLVSNGNSGVEGVLRYMTTLQPETAPLPYQSISDGDWTNPNTWLYGNSQAIPNSIGIDGATSVDWNIVRTSHNITSGNNNITLLGLDVNANTLTIENSDPLDGQSLTISDYLIIDGVDTVLKLVGESQLIQETGSIVDYSGTGLVKRDQQGTTNYYNYNYWSSPVSLDGSTFSVGEVLYDGQQPVLWTTAHNANPSTNPISLSSRWLYLYENFPYNSYADWQAINETDLIPVGLGYLMKGSGNAGTSQNYTFVGKPNNGTISTPITATYEALVGNPYPSAIDAHEFINDNNSSIEGTIYFWEHYATNNTHITVDYQGGYAAYNFSGGNPAVSPPEISGLGTPSKIPERYISVSQGFNVKGNGTGGQVTFENDQRIFVKEAVTGSANNGSVFMRPGNPLNNLNSGEDIIKRIRLDIKTPEGANRPLLLAFVPNQLATDAIDYGYDALNTEALPNDVSWMINNEKYVIQGVGDFNESKMYPLGVFLSNSGNIEISLKALENFETEIDVFVYDSLYQTYTLINDTNFVYALDAEIYTNRFYITFQANTLTITENMYDNVSINYLQNPDEIYIKTPSSIQVKTVRLINLLGQDVFSWEINNSSKTVRIPVKRISEGTYIVKVTTDSGIINKKVLIKY